MHIAWNAAHPDNQKQWNNLDRTELQAFLGSLILAGVYHSALESLDEMWSPKTGRAIFIATMPLKRFKSIMRYLRFDNKTTRAERLVNDKLAAIRDIWDMFIAQLQLPYIPGTDMTVDEQLIPFRGRCPFRQYMPSKPAKYGIKVWWNCDGTTSFPLNGQIYLGHNELVQVDEHEILELVHISVKAVI